jgi:phage terminase large subunit-like protein
VADYTFDERAASVAVAFFERVLRHSMGEWAGQPFILQPWQRQLVRDVFGWKRPDGTRRYRKVYLEIPRKNGKSTLAAGLALYLLFADGEPGAQVFAAAVDREQASIVFDEARRMVMQSPLLSSQAEVYKGSIIVPSTDSVFKVLSADAFSQHGLNAHAVIFDELHAQPGRELFDTLWTAQGARRQPLFVMITTAGYDRESVCWEQHEYARQVRDGIIDDPEWYVAIYAADEHDDWTSPETWRKANPNLGVTVKLDYLAAEAKRAEQVPAYQNTFRRLHLNQWTQQESRWLDIRAWDACSGPVDPALGAECYAGLDLASTSDIAALVLVFPQRDPEHYYFLPRFYIPAENIVERARRDRVPYDAWMRDGLLVATPGNVVDYDYIVRDIVELGKRYRIKEIAYDRWGAFQISQQLAREGFAVVEFGQGFASMSAPTKELLRLVMDRRISHGGNPILRWMADNVVVSTDPAGNAKPNKQKSRDKIDGIVAGIMALDRAMRRGGAASASSVYEERGALVI